MHRDSDYFRNVWYSPAILCSVNRTLYQYNCGCLIWFSTTYINDFDKPENDKIVCVWREKKKTTHD